MLAIKEGIIQFGFVFFLIFCFSSLIILGIRLKKARNKKICFNASSIFIALLIYELFLGFISPIPLKKSGSYYETEAFKAIVDPILGYSLGNKSFTADAIAYAGDSLSYAVKYTIQQGNRQSTYPPVKAQDSIAIFIGDSFTFGEGVNDNETLPHYFRLKSKHTYNVFNYGFHGYASHQALAIIENRILKDTTLDHTQKKLVIYSFIPDHYRRAAGHASWDTKGPLYEMEDGQILLKGSFDENQSPIFRNRFFKILSSIYKQSNIYQVNSRSSEKWIKEKDYERVYGIIIKMNELLTEKGYDFYVILDPYYSKNHKTYSALINKLNQHQINYFLGEDCMPNIEEEQDLYYIKYDKHPNRLYNETLANCFYNFITN